MWNARTSRVLFFTVAISCFISVTYYLGHTISSTPQVHSSTAPAADEGAISSRPKYAFATFLSTRIDDESYDDPYFAATRVLAYQLLHQPETRTRQGTPLIVLVPPHVSETRRQILRDEGATVIVVDLLTPESWTAHPIEGRWIDQFTKLRLYNLTQYDRILYMDSDMLLTRSLDEIWKEETVILPQKTKGHASSPNDLDLPTNYVIASVVDNERPGRQRPTPITPISRLNAGFIVFKPDTDLYNYYISLLEQPKPLFKDAYMEMGLLNYAHRHNGPMPWAALPPDQYSSNWPQFADIELGSATLHDKFWTPGNKEWIDRELVEMWWRVQGRMEGYWSAMRHVNWQGWSDVSR